MSMGKGEGMANRELILIISVLSNTSMTMTNPERHSCCSQSGTKVMEVTSPVLIDLRPRRQKKSKPGALNLPKNPWLRSLLLWLC